MKRKILIFTIILLIVILAIFTTLYIIDNNRMNNNKPVLFSTWGKLYEPSIILQNEDEKEVKEENTDSKLGIVLSLEDKVSQNSAWCGTFNLIWNDLKNDLAKTDIVFTPQTKIVENLNKGTFNTSQLSESSYYKVYGVASLELKAQIEKAILDKFNEKSDILDDFNWQDDGLERYFLYAMLKKEFKFENEFSDLEIGDFGKYKNVKYFGIDDDTDKIVRNQVKVLYYNSKEDFAIKLVTESNDEVIISRGSNKNSFDKIYEEILKKSDSYKGEKHFISSDKLKIPCISFKLKEEIEEVENRAFKFSDGKEFVIEKALQTIEFNLDKKGGKIKSEAGIMLKDNSIAIIEETPREFFADDTFTIFLIEKEKELPYFAAKITNINNVQK